MSETVLTFRNVSKSFGAVHAVKPLTLSVGAGERVVLVGQNGAGKTTIFKMLLGLTRATKGSINVFGAAPGSAEARHSIAYLPENVAFVGALTGRETLNFFFRLRGEYTGGTDALLESVGLAEAGNRAVGTYSKGMRQRLGLAQALIGSPRLLVLDEPTSGLDPTSRKTFYDIIDRYASAGTTILMSSHALAEMETHADRIIVMRDGTVVADGSMASLRRQSLLPIRIRIETRSSATIAGLAGEISGRRINGHAFELQCQAADLAAHMSRLAALGEEIIDVEIQPPGLDQIYLHLSSSDASEPEQ